MHRQRDLRRQPYLSLPCGNLETNAEEIGTVIFSFLNHYIKCQNFVLDLFFKKITLLQRGAV